MVVVVSGSTWDGDGRDGATRDQRWEVDSLGCRQDSHKISGGSALCLAPYSIGGDVGWAAETAARCLRFHMLPACLIAWPGKAGRQMIRSRGQPTGDGWPLTCDTADETRH